MRATTNTTSKTSMTGPSAMNGRAVEPSPRRALVERKLRPGPVAPKSRPRNFLRLLHVAGDVGSWVLAILPLTGVARLLSSIRENYRGG